VPTSEPGIEEVYQIVRGWQSPGSEDAKLAFDGDPSTVWVTLPDGDPPADAYVYVDLGGLKTVGQIRWQFGIDSAADQWQLQISTNRRSWTTVTESGNAPVGIWQSIDLAERVRYIRFVFLNPNGDAQIGGLAEIEVAP
jgi:hypothetical protein